MSEIIAIVFDWAGTMVDFGSRAPVIAMRNLFTGAGIAIDEPCIRRYMGMAKREHIVAILSEPEMASRWRFAQGKDWTQADIDDLMVRLEPEMRSSAITCSDLIPGAVAAVANLKAKGIRIGSTTGYSREMMAGILPAAAAQGYSPEVVICAGDTALGRPAPLMLWQALATLEAWPVARCVAVDDTPVGIAAGRNAGLWTIGFAASGNGVGLEHAAFHALAPEVRRKCMAPVIRDFIAAGADFVVESVAEIDRALTGIAAAIADGALPGSAPASILIDS